MRNLLLGACALLLALPAFAKEPRRTPLRLVSLGDSITRAINAELFLPWEGITPNRWASWVNGYDKSGLCFTLVWVEPSLEAELSFVVWLRNRKESIPCQRGSSTRQPCYRARKLPSSPWTPP